LVIWVEMRRILKLQVNDLEFQISNTTNGRVDAACYRQRLQNCSI